MGNNESERPCWANRTQLERVLILLFVATLALLVLFVALYAAAINDSDGVCLEPDCVRSANEMLTYLSESADPCGDFHQFACGNFAADNGEPSAIGEAIESNVRLQIREIIEEPIEPLSDPKHLAAAKTFYRACMNESAIEATSLNRLKGILKDIGGWPLLDGHNWRDTANFDWEATVRKLRKIGVNYDPFFKLAVVVDTRNADKYILQLQMPEIPELSTEALDSYRKYVVEIAKKLGANNDRVYGDVDAFLQFQQELFQITRTPGNSNSRNPMTIMNLQQRYTKIQWHDYINGILYPVAKINMDEAVSVPQPEYLSRLEDLLQRTPKRVLANFISWNTVLYLVPFLSEELRDEIHERDSESYYSRFDKAERWEECVQIVTESLKMPVSAAYIKKHFTEDDRVSVEEIIKLIKSQFGNVIKSLDWMDGNSKETALAKLSNVAEYISGPEELDGNELLNEIYDAVEIYEDKYLASALNIGFSNANLRYKILHWQVNDSFWLTHANNAMDSKPIYREELNTLLIPMGALQGFYFRQDRPMYLNFGTLGYAISAELSRILVDDDEQGDFRDWWTPSTRVNYNNRASCIAEQYNKLKGGHKAPDLTADELLADLIGAKVAYDAYEMWRYLKGEELPLPGLDYDTEQLFWISLGLYNCAPEDSDSDDATGGKSHIVTLLRNLDDFADDFNCPAGSYMNPGGENCEVW